MGVQVPTFDLCALKVPWRRALFLAQGTQPGGGQGRATQDAQRVKEMPPAVATATLFHPGLCGGLQASCKGRNGHSGGAEASGKRGV